MKLFRYLPFAFFSGIHGFALFAPYAAVVLAVDLTLKKARKAALPQIAEADEEELSVQAA